MPYIIAIFIYRSNNLKLDDVFSDIFGKSSRSITEQILQHPRETFDVAPFVDGRCKTPIEEIQAAVDGAVSTEQAVKLRQCLNHINELEKHRAEIAREIFRISEKYESVLNLIRTVPGFDKNPLTAIQVLSETGGDMSVFPTAKNLVSWAGCCPRNDQSNHKIKSTSVLTRSYLYLLSLRLWSDSKCWIQRAQLNPCITGSELPVHLCS